MEKLQIQKFGITKDGSKPYLYKMKNDAGMEVQVSDFGATLVNVTVLDQDKNPVEVVLGYEDAAGYENGTAAIGAIVGRNANRIGGACVTINGIDYKLAENDGKNNLHSGPDVYQKRMWEQIGKLEAEGRPERYIFGFEESYGYLSGGHVRDKDAVNATLLVCEAAAWYAQQGKTLLDAIEALYREFGYYRNALCSFAFEGESGMHTMQELMKKLRANAPEDIAGYKVESVVDYDTDGTGLPRANVLEYHLDGGHKLMVRPSGTEPKIKVYLSAVGGSEAAADAVNAALAKAAADMMKA